MTKAQVEAWLEGWRLVEAVQRQAREPLSQQRALVQMFEISDFAREITPEHHPAPDLPSKLMDPWIRLRTLNPHA